MIFHSLQYLLFLMLAVGGYYALPHGLRWILLVAASYWFYAQWNVSYLGLLLASTAFDYLIGIGLQWLRNDAVRRALLIASIGSNIGLLACFKYATFLRDSFAAFFGYSPALPFHDFVLPVGISFYTFQSLSYIIDVYRGATRAERHPGYYALYVAFFPQLVAGPIERASRMLPQYHRLQPLREGNIVRGLQWILWGLFLKLVVADNLAVYVNAVFGNVRAFQGLPLLVAAYFFALQIYGDFAGYSAIALGSARLFGIDLIENFKQPYMAVSVADFWRRWHVAISSWFRDYVYIPLGGNRVRFGHQLGNVAVTFLLSGLWHGAAWKFVAWGALHAAFLCFERVAVRLCPRAALPVNRHLVRILQSVATFHVVAVGWVFFRADSLGDAFHVLTHLFGSWRITTVLENIDMSPAIFCLCLLLVTTVAAVSIAEERAGNIERLLAGLPVFPRWLAYYALAFSVLFLAANQEAEFIYFQF